MNDHLTISTFQLFQMFPDAESAMKEWLGALTLVLIFALILVGFFKIGLPLIEKSITAVQQHNARI